MNATNPDWNDTLIDRGLAEIIGNETPPDLSNRILNAKPQASVALAESRPVSLSRTHHWVMFASAACALIALGTFAFMKPSDHLLSGRDKATNNLKEIESPQSTRRPGTTVELPEFEIIKAAETITVPDRGTTFFSGGLKRSIEGAGENIMLGVTPHIIVQEGEEEHLGMSTSDGKMNLNAYGTRDPSAPYFQNSFDHGGPAPSAGTPIAPTTSLPNPHIDLSRPYRQGSFALDPSAQPAAPTTPAAPTAGVPLLAGVPYVDRKFRNTGEGGEQAPLSAPQQSEGQQGEQSSSGDSYALDMDGRLAIAGTTVTGVQDGSYFGFRSEELRRPSVRLRIDAAPGSNVDRYLREPLGWRQTIESSGDQYTPIEENDFITAKGGDAVSTFSIDVDTASYANVRQFLEQSAQLPPPDAVRIEELVNYFPYDYQEPTDDTPFAANMEIAACPWNPEHRLARIAIKGKEMDRKARPQSNLVFLIDVSGSMNEPSKLPLLIEGMKAFTRELGENDKVAIVVYASSEGMALPSTRGDQQQTILSALDNLRAGGSTAGGAGIELAYRTATENFIKGGTNRVILCTDGDFNVGVTSTGDLTRLAEQKAKDTKVFLTVLGFGRGNLNDAMMESISGKGNGNYHYVDNLTEARKVLVEEMAGTLVTIAKDVKIQVEFNPAQVAGYRLIGYENRMLATQDFNDDKKDAGEIGAGHTVTALYEIVPAGKEVGTPSVDPLKYQSNPNPPPRSAGEGLGEGSSESGEGQGFETKGGRGGFEFGNGFGGRPQAASNELLTLKLRYKLPEVDTSTKVEYPITDKGGSFADASDDFQFAAAVASFGMMLRHSQYKGQTSFDAILEIAQSALGEDSHGYRAEFLDLVRTAKNIANN
jgi:Ca-activated chloride channel family protein